MTPQVTARWQRLVSLGFAVSLIAAVTPEGPPLVEAAKNGNTHAVRTLLQEGVDVNATEGDGTSALHWVAYRDDLESAELLIRSGADPNAANDLSVTPLWLAAENASAAMVERLLRAGADPNATLLSGETVVMRAARSGSPDVVRLLLIKGADPNATATRGQTALQWAVNQQHPAVVETLLSHGVDVDTRSEVRRELWKTDPRQGSHPSYQAWINQGGYTALLFAARVGDLASAKLLVAAGADVNDQGASGISATVLAAHANHGELVEFLLEKGADPNTAEAGYTALHAAILLRNEGAVRALLAHGADPNARVLAGTQVRRRSADIYLHGTFVGATPFWLAARFSQPNVMRLLAEHGADPLFAHYYEYWAGRDGIYRLETVGATTALMAAVGMGGPPTSDLGFVQPDRDELEVLTLEAVRLAVELGVDVSAADAQGHTASDGPMSRRFESVIEVLTE